MSDSVADRVRRGRDWLVTSGPEHGFDIDRINPATMRQTGGLHCPLAQAAGSSWADAIDHLDKDGQGDEGTWAWAIAHGFMWNDDGAEDWAELDREWQRVLWPPLTSVT